MLIKIPLLFFCLFAPYSLVFLCLFVFIIFHLVFSCIFLNKHFLSYPSFSFPTHPLLFLTSLILLLFPSTSSPLTPQSHFSNGWYCCFHSLPTYHNGINSSGFLIEDSSISTKTLAWKWCYAVSAVVFKSWHHDNWWHSGFILNFCSQKGIFIANTVCRFQEKKKNLCNCSCKNLKCSFIHVISSGNNRLGTSICKNT